MRLISMRLPRHMIDELKDDKSGLEGLKMMSVDQFRPICKGISVGESWAGKVVGPFGGNWALDQINKALGTNIDPKVASNMCKWVRVTGEKILIPAEELERIDSELARCAKEEKKG